MSKPQEALIEISGNKQFFMICFTILGCVIAVSVAAIKVSQHTRDVDKAAIEKGYIQSNGRWVSPAGATQPQPAQPGEPR